MTKVDDMIEALTLRAKGTAWQKSARTWRDHRGWWIIVEFVGERGKHFWEIRGCASEQEAADALRYANARLGL